MELDFDSDVEVFFISLLSFTSLLSSKLLGWLLLIWWLQDICINRGPKLFQKGKHVNPIYDQHMANLYHYSLRVSQDFPF